MRVRCRDSSWRCEEWSEHNIESIRNEMYHMIEYLDTALLSALKQVIGGFGMFLVMSLLLGWVGVDLKPLEKPRSELALGESGSYFQLSDNERKELVWMAKAANAAYPGVSKPLGYRSFSRKEWDACAAECDELALNLPEAKTNVKCATFNGFGLSPRFHTRTENARLATQRLRNVYCHGDLIYNNRISIGARHWGPSYSVECQGNWLEQHSIDKLVKLMVDGRTKWAGL